MPITPNPLIGLETPAELGFGEASGDDDRQLRQLRADRRHQLIAGGIRQADVDDRSAQVCTQRLDQLQRFGGGGGDSHLQPAIFEQRTDKEADQGFVFHDEDRRGRRGRGLLQERVRAQAAVNRILVVRRLRFQSSPGRVIKRIRPAAVKGDTGYNAVMSHIRVGILETGSPPPPLQERFGSYAAMVQALLGRQHEFATFDVRNGELPQGAASCNAYVITGSASGVYDGDA